MKLPLFCCAAVEEAREGTPKAPLKRAKSYRQNRATAERSEEEEGDVKDDSEVRLTFFALHLCLMIHVSGRIGMRWYLRLMRFLFP